MTVFNPIGDIFIIPHHLINRGIAIGNNIENSLPAFQMACINKSYLNYWILFLTIFCKVKHYFAIDQAILRIRVLNPFLTPKTSDFNIIS